MKKAVSYTLIICITISYATLAQSGDTVLNTVLSKPFFYNVIKDKDGRIFAGSSDGIFELIGSELQFIDKRSGYLAINEEGKPTINPEGIRFYSERKYLHLLPFPGISRDEYHTGTNRFFYLCSGGRLYVYDIASYGYSFAYHSIRSISHDITGTYSGIYLKGKKLEFPAPPYVDGYVRQYGDRAFICNYPLLVLEKEAIETGRLELGLNCLNFSDPDGKLINDVYPGKFNGYSFFMATTDKLILADSLFQKHRIAYAKSSQGEPITLIGGHTSLLHFTSGDTLMAFEFQTGKIKVRAMLNDPIIAGAYLKRDETGGGGQFILVTASGLYQVLSNRQIVKLSDIGEAHTVLPISGTELIVSTNKGLYLINTLTREESIIIKGVEFNRRALYMDGNVVKAGSVNGLYSFEISDIPKLVEENKLQMEDESDFTIVIVVAAMGSVILLLTFMSLSTRKKLIQAEEQIEAISNTIVIQKPEEEAVTREKIEQFILNDLPNASLKSILEKFKLNNTLLYTILKPEKPGSIIQSIRMAKVKELRKEGRSHEEISRLTGFSISYLKKIKIEKQEE